MAASRSERQLAEIGVFVEALYEIGGYGTWKEFADEAKISTGQISEFKNGVAEPSGYNLLRLIQVSAERAKDGQVTVAGRALGSDRLAKIEDALASLSNGMDVLLARAERQVAPRPAPAAPKKKAGR